MLLHTGKILLKRKTRIKTVAIDDRVLNEYLLEKSCSDSIQRSERYLAHMLSITLVGSGKRAIKHVTLYLRSISYVTEEYTLSRAMTLMVRRSETDSESSGSPPPCAECNSARYRIPIAHAKGTVSNQLLLYYDLPVIKKKLLQTNIYFVTHDLQHRRQLSDYQLNC